MAEHSLYTQQFAAFDGKSPAEILQELQDREEIRELISKYAHRVAHGITTSDLYVEDGTFIVRFPGRPVSETKGRDAIEALSASFDSGTRTRENPLPMIHNHVLKIRGDEAEGTCSNELRMSENGKSMIGSGYYRDRYRRENGRWWFVTRDMHFIHWVPIQQGWAKSEAG
jgi:hypothetical protein